MALRKQNRTIWILATIVFLLLITFLFKEGRFDDFLRDPKPPETASAPSEEQFGEKVVDSPIATELSNRKNEEESLELLSQCLQIAGSGVLASNASLLEKVIASLQKEFGPISHQADRWMTWHLRTHDGKERRLRLEIIETDEGKIGKELHSFAVNRDGEPVPMEIEPEKANNPSDAVIGQMLKEGEVFYKEKAAVAFFPNMERMEYVEKDGDLAEVEIHRKEHQFRCKDVRAPETCQCL